MVARSTAELRKVCEDLAVLVKRLEAGNRTSTLPPSRDELLAKAQSIYNGRRVRAQYFSPQLVGEPGWDILLDLFIRSLRNQRVTVTNATAASCVPQTTALRHISLLEREGFIERSRAPGDGRVNLLQLTDLGLERMTALIGAYCLE